MLRGLNNVFNQKGEQMEQLDTVVDPRNGKVYVDDYSHLGEGEIYKGKVIEGFTEEGHPHAGGRNLVKNTFLPGNRFGKGRVKGSRNKLTQKMLDDVANSRTLPHEYLIRVMEFPTSLPEERLKAAMKLVDIVYPKAASVEVDMSIENDYTPAEMEERIRELALKHLRKDESAVEE